MPEIPTAEQLGARPLPPRQPQIRQAQPTQGAVTEAAGRGLAQLGETLAQFQEINRQKQDQRRKFNTQTSWLNFNTQVDSNYQQTAQTEFEQDAGAFDFVDRAMNQYDQQGKAFMEALGPDASSEEVSRWQSALNAKRFEVFSEAQEFQDKEQTRYYTQSLQDQLDQALIEVNRNPDDFARWNQLFIDSVRESGLNDRQKNVLFRKVPSQFLEQTVNGLMTQRRFGEASEVIEAFADASDADGRAASINNPIVNRLVEVGNAGARIKLNDTEQGAGNLSNARWLQLLEQNRPDIMEAYGEDEQGLLALRGENQLVRELLADQMEAYSKELDSLEIDPSPANLYLASTFGLSGDGGLQEILQAKDTDFLSGVLPNDIYAQNRTLFDGKDVGWLKKYAEDKMVKSGDFETKVTNADRLFVGPAFINDLRGKVQTAQDTYLNAQATKRRGDYELAIANDPFSVTHAQINNDSSLKSGQKADLINTLNTRQKEARKKQELMRLIEYNPRALIATKKDHRDAVNAYYLSQAAETQEIYAQEGREFTPEDALNVAVEVTKRTGIAPPDLVAQVQQGLLSYSSAEFAASSEMADRLNQASGTAFLGQGAAKEVRDAAVDWRLHREYLNLPPEQAAQILQPIYDPAQKQDADTLGKLADATLKDLTFGDVENKFDQYALGDNLWFFQGLTIGEGTDGDEAKFLTDWKRLSRINFINANGNQEIADARTAKDMRRLWGPTENGPPGATIVRNPIEGQYPLIDPEIIRSDVIDDVRRTMGDDAPPDENIFVVQTEVTRGDIRAGRDPRYMIMYRVKDEDTDQYKLETVPGGGLYRPPEKDSQDYERAAEQAFRKKQFEDRYIGGYWEDPDIFFDRADNRVVKRDEEGNFAPLHNSGDAAVAPLTGGALGPIPYPTPRAPARPDELASNVGTRLSLDSIVGGFLDMSRLARGQALETRIPTPEPKPRLDELANEFDAQFTPENVARGLLDAAQLTRGQALQTRIPTPRARPGVLDQVDRGFQDVEEMQAALREQGAAPIGTGFVAQAATGFQTIARLREEGPVELNEETFLAQSRLDLEQILGTGKTRSEQLLQAQQTPAYRFTGTGLSGRIIAAESGGRTKIKNPNSSAYGPGQFINSTWLSLIKKYRPDLEQNRTRAQILQLREDPDLSAQMVDRYAEENTALLRKNNLPVNPASVYLMHFLGPDGGRKVLRAKDSTLVSRILPNRVIRSNTFLRGKTVGYVKRWAARKMN